MFLRILNVKGDMDLSTRQRLLVLQKKKKKVILTMKV